MKTNTLHRNFRLLVSIVIAVLLIITQVAPVAAVSTWSDTGPLVTPRMWNTALLLQNGKVLVAGGLNGATAVQTAELFDPTAGSNGTWSETGPLASARAAYAAAVLADGRALVVGGHNWTSGLGTAELYDPTSGLWSPTGSLPSGVGVAYATATLLNNGNVLVAGGTENGPTSPTRHAFLYNPTTGTFTATGNMAVARIYHSATLLPDGKVLVVGGTSAISQTTGSNALASAELYNPGSGTWTSVPTSMATARMIHTGTLLANGKVLVAGGTPSVSSYGQGFATDTATLYNPSTNGWEAAGTLITGRYHHTATRMDDGQVIIAGGSDIEDDSIASAEVYDPTANSWTAVDSMSTVRIFHTAVLVNHKVLVVGGTASPSGYDNSLAACETYSDQVSGVITLGNLNQVYDGAPKPVTVTTVPPDLSVTVTYTGTGGMVYGPTETPPSNAGSYTVSATSNDPLYPGSATETLVIAKATATVTLGSLSHTYDGTSKQATATTSPSGLTVNFTYNGSSTLPINAGGYAVVATVADANYQGTANGTLVIGKASATVSLGSLSQTYTGSQLHATATTSPSGLTVSFTYDGSTTTPTNAGSYAVVGTVSDINYQGSANGTLVIAKANATVTLGGLSQTYNGSPRTATATTTPSGLLVSFTYNASSTAPTNAGTYAVVGTVADPNYQGSANGNLVIAKATATFQFSGLSQTYNGSPRPVTVTTTPTGLGLTLSYVGTGGTVYGPSPTAPSAAGAYSVTATVDDPNGQGSATETLVVAKATATVNLGNLSHTYDGTPKQATATTTPAGLTVALTYNGSSTPPTAAGSYPVAATINDTNYQGSANGTLVIAKATATVTLGSLSHTYDGTQKHAIATTSPTGLTVNFTYAGSTTQPTNAGSYAVVGTVSDINYQGSANGTLVIAKANATVTLGGLSQTYNGSPKPVTVTTQPVGLNVIVSYEGTGGTIYGSSATAPTAAGSYIVTATVDDPNGQGSATETLTIAKAAAVITLENLSQVYDGSPKPITVTTAPAGLTVHITYNGSATPPTEVGSYAIVVTVEDPNYQGTQTGTLNITTTQPTYYYVFLPLTIR